MKNLFSVAALAIFTLSLTAFKSSQNASAIGLPDLCIENIEVKCKAQRWLVFDVKNAGTEKSAATLIRIRPIDNDDATQKCIQQAVRTVPQLMPGKVFHLRVPLKDAPGCDCNGPLKFELFIDHKDNIQETDESNNKLTLEV